MGSRRPPSRRRSGMAGSGGCRSAAVSSCMRRSRCSGSASSSSSTSTAFPDRRQRWCSPGLRCWVGRSASVPAAGPTESGARVVPLRLAGLGIVGVMLLTAVLAGGPTWLLVPVLGLAGGLTMAWNGLSFTAAAELAGALRSGATIGVQQTVLAAIGVAAPVVFAATVSSGSWPLAFVPPPVLSLAGWWLLGPLSERRHTATR